MCVISSLKRILTALIALKVQAVVQPPPFPPLDEGKEKSSPHTLSYAYWAYWVPFSRPQSSRHSLWVSAFISVVNSRNPVSLPSSKTVHIQYAVDQESKSFASFFFGFHINISHLLMYISIYETYQFGQSGMQSLHSVWILCKSSDRFIP